MQVRTLMEAMGHIDVTTVYDSGASATRYRAFAGVPLSADAAQGTWPFAAPGVEARQKLFRLTSQVRSLPSC